MAIKRSPLSSEEVEARRRNGRQSTGPRPEAGQGVLSPQALRYGSHWERQVNMMMDLDENPFEYVTLCDSLVEALRPTHAAQRMVVEQIAMWRWQERRAVRAQVARQALSVEH